MRAPESAGLRHRALDRLAVVVDGGAIGRDDGPVVLLEVADAAGERGQRERVGAEIHLAVAIADGERAAAAGADHEVVAPGEDNGEREGAVQPPHGGGHRLLRRLLLLQIAREEMGDDLGIGLRDEDVAERAQLAAQLVEVLDDAVVDDGDAVGGVRVGVGLVGAAVGGPAGVADADGAGERFARQQRLEIAELALGAPARDVAVHQRRDAGGIVAAIFEALEPVEQQRRHRGLADDAENAAHQRTPSEARGARSIDRSPASSALRASTSSA